MRNSSQKDSEICSYDVRDDVMLRAKPLSEDELEQLKHRIVKGSTIARLLATIDERDKKVAKLLEELHYLRSLYEEGRPSKVIHFWLNKSLEKYDASLQDEGEEPQEENEPFTFNSEKNDKINRQSDESE